MDTYDSAPGAPQRSFARPPTGFRRMTPGLLKADRSADGFAGLPDGVERLGQFHAPRGRLAVHYDDSRAKAASTFFDQCIVQWVWAGCVFGGVQKIEPLPTKIIRKNSE